MKTIQLEPHPLRGCHSSRGVDLLVTGSIACVLGENLGSDKWLQTKLFGVLRGIISPVSMHPWNSWVYGPLKAQVCAKRKTSFRGRLFERIVTE